MTGDTRPVVAELGRPETTEETAARKAEASRNHRTRQTAANLVYSLLAALVLVAVIVLMVPRANPNAHPAVDYQTVAAQGAGLEPDPLVSPELPSSWHANAARFTTDSADGIDSWYIGLITPDDEFLGITQGFDANPTWLVNQVRGTRSTDTVTIGGLSWSVYDNRSQPGDHGNVDYALTTRQGASTYVLFGSAGEHEFQVAATAVADDIEAGGR